MRSNSLHAAISDLAALRPNWSLLADTLPDEFLRQVKGEIESLSAEVKRLRDEVLGSPKFWVASVPVGDRERPRLMTYQPTGSKGYYAVLVRLAPDGLGLAGEVDNKEGADA